MNTEPTPGNPLERIVSLHTPGPWAWENGALRPVEPYKAGACFAVLLNTDGGRVRRDCDIDAMGTEQQANLRLIAAAPDLLDALQHARDELASCPRSFGYGITALPKIDAAIAKATGVQSNAALSGSRTNQPDEPSV